MHRVKISAQLLDSVVMIGLSTPDFQFDHELLAVVIDHDIHAASVNQARFDIIMTSSVDDWNQRI